MLRYYEVAKKTFIQIQCSIWKLKTIYYYFFIFDILRSYCKEFAYCCISLKRFQYATVLISYAHHNNTSRMRVFVKELIRNI